MDRESAGLSLRQSRAFLHVNRTIEKYARQFFVKVDHFSVQGDHIHLLIRTTRRSQYQHFFRVVAGQIAQGLRKTKISTGGGKSCGTQSHSRHRVGKYVTDTPAEPRPGNVTDTPNGPKAKKRFWLHRPYTRVVKGWRGYKTVRDYILLNEAEAAGRIPYRKERLRGISDEERKMLALSSSSLGPRRSHTQYSISDTE